MQDLTVMDLSSAADTVTYVGPLGRGYCFKKKYYYLSRNVKRQNAIASDIQ